MKTSDFAIHSTDKLDILLSDCVSLLLKKRSEDPEYWGMVSAAIHDPDNNTVFGVNHIMPDGTRKHAERVAMENYTKRYGKIPSGCIIVTTLSPCSDDMSERWHESCTELLNNSLIKKVYAGYSDPSQGESQAYKHKQFHLQITKNKKLNQLCQMIGQQAIK